MKTEIVFALNQSVMVGLFAAINSIVKNTPSPKDIRFNVVVPKGESLVFEDSFNQAFKEFQPDFRIQEYEPPQFIQGFIEAKYAPLGQREEQHSTWSILRYLLSTYFLICGRFYISI
jgi:hypothetical protein